MISTTVNLAVDDVRVSSQWYQSLLGCRSAMNPDHEHRNLFDLLCDEDDNTVLILSRWDHNPLPSLNDKPSNPGKGVGLVFVSPSFDRSWAFAKVNAEIVEKPHLSRGFEVPEFTVLDPDGYTVTISDGKAKATDA